MPLPTPSAGETESDFIGRCMHEVSGEFDSQEQRLAVCYSQWGHKKMLQPATRDALVAAAKGGDGSGLLVRKAVIPEVEPGEGRVVRFVISTGDVDRDGDTIDPKGWDLRPYLKNPVVLWAHDYRSLPVGKAVSVAVSDGKLVSECEFADHEFAETVYQMVRRGFLRATSVGFRPTKYVINEQRHGLDFAEQELMEYSIVPVPSNPEALVDDLTAAKAAGLDVEPLRKWAEGVLSSLPEEPVTTPPEPEPQPEAPAVTDVPEEPVKAPPEDDEDEEEPGEPEELMKPEAGRCRDGYEMGEDGMCHLVTKKACEDVHCRVCQFVLPVSMPRLRDDLGVVCAPCFLRAGRTADQPEAPAPEQRAAVVEEEAVAESVLDLDDDQRGVVVELDDEPVRDEGVVDMAPDEVRAVLRSAITSAVSTIVRDETRAALNRARGRVD